MLATLLGHHRGALRASMWQEYGIDLNNHGQQGALDLADLAVNIPNGSAVWKEFGGPRAWSDDLQGMILLELRLRELQWSKTDDGKHNRNRPEAIDPPQYAHEERVQEAVTKRRIDKYLNRQTE